MGGQQQIDVVREIRSLLAKLIRETNVPAIYQCYKEADMSLHWALWLQGETNEIMPELEVELNAPS